MIRGGVVSVLILSLMFVEFCHCYSNQNGLLARSATARRLHEIGRRIRNFVSWIKNLANQEDTFVGRCAGLFKRLRMTLTFIVFKLGVIMTTLAFLTILAFKSVGIGVLLLILSSVGLTSKLHALKHNPGHWQAPPTSTGLTAPHQTIHLHVHKGGEHETKISHVVPEPHYPHSSSEYYYDHHYDHDSPSHKFHGLYDYHHHLDGLYPRNDLERSAVAELYKRLGLVKMFDNNSKRSVNRIYSSR